MLIQLPVETWIEILDWLRRRDLIKKLDKLWDRQFTPIVQDWLHKYATNVKLGRLWARQDGLHVWNQVWEKVPFAEVELPENVTSFQRITIGYMDSTVLAFFRRLRRLFHNNCLRINSSYTDELPTQTALRLLMPMINSESIETITFDCKLLQFLSANHPSALFNAKLLQICSFSAMDSISELILLNWLFTPHADGKPRTLLLFSFSPNPAGFWEKLQERFLEPVRQLACPFVIRMRNNLLNLPVPMVIGNARTDEQLTVKCVSDSMLISNCTLNIDQEWLAKNEEEVCFFNIFGQQQAIWLDCLELGPLDSDDEDDPQQQPSPDSSEANPQKKPGTSNLEEEEPGKKRARLI